MTYLRHVRDSGGLEAEHTQTYVTHPREAEAADSVSEHVAEQRRVGVEGGEVGVHVRALPVRDLQQSTDSDSADVIHVHVRQAQSVQLKSNDNI